MRTHPQNVVPGAQTFESMIAFLTDPKAVKEHLAKLSAATEELRKATEQHTQAVAQIVEAEKIVQAVQAAQDDRRTAREVREQAEKDAGDIVLKATAEAKTLLADAQRAATETENEIAARTEVLDAQIAALEPREEAVKEKEIAAAALMTEAQDMYERATTLRESVEAKARRMAEAAQS